MEFSELLKHRRSTRAFTGKAVTSEQLNKMLNAGILAPNACNAQCWHFFCTLDKAYISQLVPDVYKGAWVKDAGCVILLCTDPAVIEARFGSIARERFAVQDTAAAATQILQCASDIGLAGCWMGAFDHDKAREFFSVPESMEPVILLAIGEAVNEAPFRARKPLDEVVTMIGEVSGEGVLETEESSVLPYTVRGTNLPDSLFEDVNFKRASFRHAKLENAEFDDINMAGAKFNNINLSGAQYTDINMSDASYGGMCMDRSRFGCVDMKDAVFSNPDLSRTVFENCTLRDVKINGCDISGLTIDGVNIEKLLEKYKQGEK
nr:nitroreductase family protein [Clostridia bacterium]